MKKLIIFSIIIILAYGCCKNDPIDPCKDVKKVKASFWANNIDSLHPKWMVPFWLNYDYTTQGIGGCNWEINNELKWDSIEWRIGSETIYNQTSIFRSNFPDNSYIPITLIVKATPNKSCFPSDNGRDTITKIYHFVKTSKRFLGRYRGAFIDIPNFKDTFEFNTLVNSNLCSGDCYKIDTFPFTSCKNQIEFSGINYAFVNSISRADCPPSDTNRRPTTFYIRFIDNSSNNVEIILNPSGSSSSYPYPKMVWRGYKL